MTKASLRSTLGLERASWNAPALVTKSVDQVQPVAQPYLRGFKDLNDTDIRSYQALVDVFYKEGVLKEKFDVKNVLLKGGDIH